MIHSKSDDIGDIEFAKCGAPLKPDVGPLNSVSENLDEIDCKKCLNVPLAKNTKTKEQIESELVKIMKESELISVKKIKATVRGYKSIINRKYLELVAKKHNLNVQFKEIPKYFLDNDPKI